MFGLDLSDSLQILLSATTLIAVVITVFWGIKKPNISQDQEIALIKKTMFFFRESITSIKENHLAHIEKDVCELKLNMKEIITIINERIPKK